MKWPIAKFADVAEIVTGITPPKKDPDNYGPGIPWVKPPDLDAWEPVTQTAETLSSKGQKLARLLPEGTVMVCCIGSIGRVGIAGTTLATNQQINSLIFGPTINPKFGYYYCRHITQQFQAAACNAVVPILNKSNFSKIEIPVPPLSEQRRIVEILDQADALRKKRAEADAKAARILPALFYKMFGDPATNPKGWHKGVLGDVIVKAQYGTSVRADADGRGVAVIRMNNINGSGGMDLTDIKYADLSKNEREQYALEPGDILFNRTNSKELVGKTGLWRGEMPAVAASYLIRVRVDPAQVRPEFIWAYMNSPYIKQMLFDKCRRAIGMANINAKELRALPLIIPPLQMQQAFVTQLTHTESLVKRGESALVKSNGFLRCFSIAPSPATLPPSGVRRT